jgi:hypothetical protein
LLLASSAAANAGDRIFADGFEACCRIGGTVYGLSGNGLVLHLSAGVVNENRPIASNGVYDFQSTVPPGTAFTLSIGTQPNAQVCSYTLSGGTMGNASITNADLVCGGNLIWNSGNWGQNWN